MIVVPASYSFPTADNTTPRYQDSVLGPTDLIRSRTGFFTDPNPIFGPGLPNTLLRQDDGQLIYGTYGATLDDEPVALIVTIGVTNLGDDGGLLITLNPVVWPSSPVGLPAGAVWNNGTFVSVVPGAVPNPSASPQYFGLITEATLLTLGGGNLPLSDPHSPKRLWNNGGFVAISFG